jgi:C-terminal processing protease CtpA/Prc
LEKIHRFKGLVYPILLGIVCLCFISCKTASVQYDINRKFSAPELTEDFNILKGALEANHPSLYWYTSKDSIDWAFSTVFNSMTDSMNEHEFRNKLAWAVSKIRDGHTTVRFSRRYNNAINKSKLPVFPLALKAWKDSLVVLGSAFRNDSVFTRGTIILSINNRTPGQLLDSMFEFISTDGYADNFKNQVVSFNFGIHYKNAFGLDSLHQVSFIDSNGVQKTVMIRNYDPKTDTVSRRGRRPTQVAVPTRRERTEAEKLSRRSITIDTPLNTAYIRVATFSSAQLRQFFRKSFRTIKKQGISNVVLDLRENGGGNIMNSTRLSQYLVKQPFKLADTVAAISRRFRYGNYIRPSLAYRISMFFTSRRKRADGRYHFAYFENKAFKPKKKYHFDGDVYLIQGGYSFSATTLFINSIKGQQNVTVVGEETGGGSYGNSAVHLPQIILPNTKIRVVLPIYRLVMDASKPKTGRGIFPDVEADPSSVALREGYDPKITKVKELIQKKKK